MRRVAADECDDDPRSEERRLGAPALLGEVSPARGQQKKGRQDKQKRVDPVHGRGEKLGGDEAHRVGNGGCSRKVRILLLCYADTGYMAEALVELKGCVPPCAPPSERDKLIPALASMLENKNPNVLFWRYTLIQGISTDITWRNCFILSNDFAVVWSSPLRLQLQEVEHLSTDLQKSHKGQRSR